VNAVLVNWLPWSVLTICGVPSRPIAASSASTQNWVSIVIGVRQASTFQLCQSITVARYTKPSAIGM
jgi:hypothetical protein